MYSFVQVSGLNLENSQNGAGLEVSVYIIYVHNKTVPNHFGPKRGGGSKIH
jgi:hypothetical protein